MSTGSPIVVVAPHGPVLIQPGRVMPRPEVPVDDENVVLIPDYFPGKLADFGHVRAIATALDMGTVNFNPSSTVSGRGIAVNDARKAFSAFLRHAAYAQARDLVLGRDDDHGVVGWMLRGEFQAARGNLASLGRVRGPGLDAWTIEAALTPTSVEYTVDLGPGPPQPRRLPGYTGPDVSSLERAALEALGQLLTGGGERAFRLPLLEAECHMGLRDPEAALGLYAQLFAADLSAARRRFVAIRAGYAHLAVGERRYRGTPRPGLPAPAATAAYDAAVMVLKEHGVPESNLERRQITNSALMRINTLRAGLNVLGLRDSFVPVYRYTHLAEKALAAIDACIDTARAFEQDLREAEEQIGVRFDIAAESDAEEDTGKINALQVDNATLTVGEMNEKVALIEAQKDFLLPESIITGAGNLIEAAVATGYGTPAPNRPFSGGPGVVGVMGTTVHYFAQRNELNHQLAMAQKERSIATNQAQIARLQQQLSADRQAHLERKAAFLDDRMMNADFLYARAAVRERRAYRELDVAIFLAYLCERALVFLLGKVNIIHIRFDYLDTEPGVLAAAEALKAAFLDMQVREETDLHAEQAGDFCFKLPLRHNYPLQFERFLASNDGKLDFVYSLYQLSKGRPATQHCRLYAMAVEVKGLAAEGALRGTLSHTGRFLVRDRQLTMDETLPPDQRATRLVPTDEQLEQALARQAEQGTAVAAVGGVLFYTLPNPDVLDLTEGSSLLPPPPQTITLNTFEKHAPTGLWSLQIEDHRRLAITDIVLHFGIVNRQSDPGALRTRVLELVAAYEQELSGGDQLDRVDVISLRAQLPDAFFALENGLSTFDLDVDLFDPQLADLRLKTVIVQAVDEDGAGLAGIEVEIRRDEFGFVLRRTTRVDGFSEDLNVPLPILERDERFDVLGQWRLVLPQPAQFASLGELRLVVMYGYTEL